MLRFTQLSVLSNDSVQDLLDNYIRDENVKKNYRPLYADAVPGMVRRNVIAAYLENLS